MSRATSSLPKITIFTRSYPPAYLTGGPARSLFGLVESLAADFRFSVVTSAFDDPAAGPMESVKPGRWSKYGQAMIWYEPRYRMPARKVISLLRETKPQVVYLNSLYDYRFAILPLLLTQIISRGVPVVLAPRGELSAGALALKRNKKRLYITIFRLLGLHKAVTWHASTSRERSDIERMFGVSVRIHVAIDLRADLSCEVQEANPDHVQKTDQRGCSLVFFSRIVPIKNVATVIKAMSLVKGEARLSIAGPIEDTKYWGQCLELIDNIGDPDLIKYVGTITAGEAVNFLKNFDLLVIPTYGENFGHVILESLAAGTPVIVGHDTPWDQIEVAGAGWMCDPSSPGQVADLIERFLSFDKSARLHMRLAAKKVAAKALNDFDSISANRAMFRTLTSCETE